MDLNSNREAILHALQSKSCLKQQIFQNTIDVFDVFKKEAEALVNELVQATKNNPTVVELEYAENGAYEFQVKIAGDTIIFTMHTNVFNFYDDHSIHKIGYTEKNKENIYCGMIEIYNFLSDSFRYDRLNDTGYLIGRLFINRENHFFVEGTRQLGFLYNDFANMILNPVYIKAILESAILYSIDFDLWAPAFAEVQELSVAEMITKNGVTPHKTAKRLGFNLDDVKSVSKSV